MASVRGGSVGVRDAVPVGSRAAQRRFTLAMVGNVILMVVLLLALTFGGFLYMDYKIEEAKARKMDKRVGELRRQFLEDCRKE